MNEREELEALRRLAELEAKASGAAPSKSTQPEQGFVRKLVGPTVQALGAVGGGALGTALGPAGTVGGAGLGYGIANQLLGLYDQMTGTKKPPQSVEEALTGGAKDVLEGATMEAGGRVVAPLISRAAGKVTDLVSGNLPKVKAAIIAKQSAGPDLEALKLAMRESPEGYTAAQATANINSPTWQALAERAGARDPRFYGGTKSLKPTQESQFVEELQRIARGENQTSMRAAREGAVDDLNKRLIPTLKTELNAANTAGKLKPVFDAEAKRFASAAESKVEDVRRFSSAAERAAERAHTTTGPNQAALTAVPGYPRQPGRYTYMGELEKKAEQVAQQAADASLPFGEAARFAKAASDSLEAHGLRPLESKKVIGSINKTLANPEFAGDAPLKLSLRQVAKDIKEWSNNGGIIDAFALDAIRKNSVNGTIERLYPAADKDKQKELAAIVLNRLKPVVIDAIENAGGTGYRAYLRDYSAGRQAITQSELGAKAVDLFKTNKKGFAEFVRGDAPRDVEKIFGPGQYNIAEEMSPYAMQTLRGIENVVTRTQKAGEQATAGQEALSKILESNISRWKIPWGLSPKTMAMNQALGRLEHKIGTKTMNTLAEGMKSGKSAQEMLSMLPAKERVGLLWVLNHPENWAPGMSAGLLAPAMNE